MCGLVGVFGVRPVSDRSWLKSGNDIIMHRGPDSDGEWWSDDGRVGLAHRRLSIIDLTEAGHQPMHFSSNELSIVFNGEIYNYQDLREELASKGHQFASNTDTEVVLASYKEWGVDCLQHFNGMFAFALYDLRSQIGFLARDRAGEKPLFLCEINGELRFSSELKALLVDRRLPRTISRKSLDFYLAMGYVPSPHCILDGFKKLPPAGALLFDLKTGLNKTWQYWEMPVFQEDSEFVVEKNLLDELEILLSDSVRLRMIADVPVGVLLSGGVDSSLITAIASRSSDVVRTFTVGFPGHGALDETEHARLVATEFSTIHTELVAEDASADFIPKLAKQFCEPMADSSMIPTFLVSHLVRQHCKVALGGDGGDELFGGYDHYSRFKWIEQKTNLIPTSIKKFLSRKATEFLPVGFKGRNWVQGLGVDFKFELPQTNFLFDAKTRASLMSQHQTWPLVAESQYQQMTSRDEDLVQRATRTDFLTYLAEDLLVKVDRASMLSSLEVRLPLLDHRLVEFAFKNVPANLKATETRKKILLKKFASRLLPNNFDIDRKQGFSIPLNEWLKSDKFKNLFHDVLLDPSCIFDTNATKDLLWGQNKGCNNGERLFSLVLFEIWRNEYEASI